MKVDRRRFHVARGSGPDLCDLRAFGGIVALGNPALFWHTEKVFADSSGVPKEDMAALAGFFIEDSGRAHRIWRPSDGGRFLAPRGVFDGHVVHVVWGETRDTSSLSDPYVTDLRYATFDGHSWTSARTILTGRKIWWNISSRPPLLENGALVIAVPAEETSTSFTHRGVAILTMLRGELQTGWISTHGPLPSAVSIAAIPSRGFALAFIGAVVRSYNASINNSLVGANSTDGGRTWTDPYAIETLGYKRADDLRMLTVRGQAHLFWTVDATAAGDSAVLAHRVSTNGVVWHDDRSVRFARSINALDVVAFEGAITAIGRDSLALLWGVERRHAYPLFPSLPVPALVTSRRSVQCR